MSTGDAPSWPVCGHGLEDDAILYDRPLCVRCEETAGDRQSGSKGIDGP